jgi:hypothetical protein
MQGKRTDSRGNPFGMKWTTRIEIRETGRSWNEVKGIAGDRNA